MSTLLCKLFEDGFLSPNGSIKRTPLFIGCLGGRDELLKKLLMRLRAAGDGAAARGAVPVCVCFVIGALLGGLCAAYGGEPEELASAAMVPQLGRITALDAAVTMFRYPVLALLCGLAVFGVIAEPLLAGARGFFLCFAATALMRLYGGAGLLLAAARGTVECLISIPCFLYLAAGGFVSSASIIASIGGRAKPGTLFSKLYLIRTALILALIGLGTLAELYITPILVSAAAGLIS